MVEFDVQFFEIMEHSTPSKCFSLHPTFRRSAQNIFTINGMTNTESLMSFCPKNRVKYPLEEHPTSKISFVYIECQTFLYLNCKSSFGSASWSKSWLSSISMLQMQITQIPSNTALSLDSESLFGYARWSKSWLPSFFVWPIGVTILPPNALLF